MHRTEFKAGMDSLSKQSVLFFLVGVFVFFVLLVSQLLVQVFGEWEKANVSELTVEADDERDEVSFTERRIN